MDKPPPVKLRFEPRPAALLGALMLASPLSGFITGEILDLNGGLLMD